MCLSSYKHGTLHNSYCMYEHLVDQYLMHEHLMLKLALTSRNCSSTTRVESQLYC